MKPLTGIAMYEEVWLTQIKIIFCLSDTVSTNNTVYSLKAAIDLSLIWLKAINNFSSKLKTAIL